MKEPSQPAFGFRNKRDIMALLNVLMPVFFITAVGIYFHEFVWNAISENYAINLGIIFSASFGVFLILMRLVAAQEDFHIIDRFGYEAKQGVYMKTLLEQPWIKARYVRHYLSHIAHTGGTLSTQLEYSSIENELHALQADYDSRLELPQFLVGFMIAMGLLGTFIGLLRTLTGISGMLDHMGGAGADMQKEFMQLVVELRKPLAGMGIAFSASMFGLITSLMLAIMMTNLRRYISRVISLARNVMHELTEMTREKEENSGGINLSPQDIDLLLAGEEHTSAGLLNRPAGAGQVGRPSVYSSGSGIDPVMVGRFDVLTKKIELLLEAFESNTETTRRLNDLIGFGPRMKEISEKSLDEMRGLSAKNNDQQRLLEAIVDQIRDSREVAIGSARHLNDLKEIFTKIGKSTSMVELIASGIGGQTSLLEILVEEMRRSQQGLTMINRSIQEAKTGSNG
jgi:methyl-accepting chemotaxis protein